MSDCEHLTAARRIRAALDQASEALVGARLEGVLAAEEPLASSVAAWPAAGTAGGPDREPLRREMIRLRASLDRCRRLGAGLAAFAGTSSSVSGWARGYDRSGAARACAVPGVRALEARL